MDDLGHGVTGGVGSGDGGPTHPFAVYRNGLYAYCLSLLGEVHEAAEVTDGVLAFAAQAHGRGESPAPVRPWLFRLARDEVMRRSPEGPRVPSGDLALPGDPHVQRRHHRVWMAASRLDPLDRELLDLAWRHDLDEAEIAQVIGVSPAEVARQLAGARVMLEAAFAPVAEPTGVDGSPGGAAARYAALPLPVPDVVLPRLTPPVVTPAERRFLEADTAAHAVPDIRPPAGPPEQPRTPFGGPSDPAAVPPETYRRRRLGLLAAGVAVFVLLSGVAAVAGMPRLLRSDRDVALPTATGSPFTEPETPPGTAPVLAPVSGAAMPSSSPSESDSRPPGPSRFPSPTVVPSPSPSASTTPPAPPPPPPENLAVTASVEDATQGCPTGWTAIIRISVTGGTPARVTAMWRHEGGRSEQVATDDGGGRYHVVVSGLPYDKTIGYRGVAIDAKGRATYSTESYVARPRTC